MNKGMFVEECVVSCVKLFDHIDIADRDEWFVAWEEDNCLVEVVAYFDVTPLNTRMFIFSVVEILEEVGNVTEDGVRCPNAVDMILLSTVVVVRDVHADHPLVEHVGEQQVPKTATCDCTEKAKDRGIHYN